MSVPRLEIWVPLEGTVKLFVVADGDEDAHALLSWLGGIDLGEVGANVEQGLDLLRRAA